MTTMTAVSKIEDDGERARSPESAVAPVAAPPAEEVKQSAGLGPRCTRLVKWCELLGFTWFVPLVYIAAGVSRGFYVRSLVRMVGLPLLAIAVFLGAWQLLGSGVSLNEKEVPTPAIVGERLIDFFYTQPMEQGVKEAAYEAEMLEMADGDMALYTEMLAEFPFESDPSIYTKIGSSLVTVFTGFLIAALIAIPIGIVSGLSRSVHEAMNPIIQVLKPISPIAWLPVFYAILLAVKAQQYDSVGAEFPVDFAFLVAAVVVAVCSLWPTLLNTANGVANVDRDYLNVSRVLNHGWFTRVFRVVLPASLPMVFTGLRLSLSIGWMVLIAAEMLSNSNGIGLFIWEMYNNGSSDSITVMLVAVIAIGVIGFALDRAMIVLQKMVSHGAAAEVR